MEFDAIKNPLGERGWKIEGDVITSPSGALRIARGEFDAGKSELYAGFARRESNAITSTNIALAAECRAAMDALARDEVVQRLQARHERFEAIVTPWLRAHRMLTTSWDFSSPSLRGTGRHPDGGLAALEVIHVENDVWTLVAYHWQDDRIARKRRSWTRRWEGMGSRAVQVALGKALLELLISRREAAFVESELSGDEQSSKAEHEWLASLPLLQRSAG